MFAVRTEKEKAYRVVYLSRIWTHMSVGVPIGLSVCVAVCVTVRHSSSAKFSLRFAGRISQDSLKTLASTNLEAAPVATRNRDANSRETEEHKRPRQNWQAASWCTSRLDNRQLDYPMYPVTHRRIDIHTLFRE